MKVNSVIRPECGTEAGYKKHNRQTPKEVVCQPCRDAHNAWRRDYHARNPHKNIEHGSKYREENREVVRERNKKYYTRVPEEQKLEKKLLSAAKAALKRAWTDQKTADAAAEKAVKKIAHQAQMAINARNRSLEVEAYRAEKKAKHDAEVEARRLERERLKAEKDALKPAPLTPEEKLAKKEACKQATHERRMARVVKHGTTLTEYKWCKYQNEVPCKPCRAVAAEYVRGRPGKLRYNKVHGKRRRHLARANGETSYTRQFIFDRDGYECHICGEMTDPTAPHVMGQPGWERYPHLDHVIPISKGGTNTPDNVKVAHAECNLLKGDKVANTPEMTV